MAQKIYRAQDRGHANFGWLDAKYSFSFNRWYDPERVNFGLLRVLNDDTIAGGAGFGKHPHENMEIVTIPLQGALEHEDNTGHSEVLRPGDVQIMSAGRGIIHSEFNHLEDEETKLFQIWIFPEKTDIDPRYDQKKFEETARRNKWQLLVSPEKGNGALWINQQARIWRGRFSAGRTVALQRAETKAGVFLMVIAGSITLGDETLDRRDAVGIDEQILPELQINETSDLLLIEVPMR